MALYIGLCTYLGILLFASLDKKISSYRLNEKSNKKKTAETVLFIVSLLFMWFLVAFRAPEVGNDTTTYIWMFDIYSDAKNISFANRTEIGWQMFCFLIGRFTDNPHVFLFVVASIMYLLLGIYIYKYCDNILISLIILFAGFFSSTVSMLRQMTAMIFVAFAYQNLRGRKKLNAFFLILLASTLHSTAALAFLLFAKNWIKKFTPYTLQISAVVLLLSISGIIQNVILKVVPVQFTGYFEGQYVRSGYLAVTVTIIHELIFYYIHSQSEDFDDPLLRTNLFLMLTISSFGYTVNLFTRLAEYFYFITYLHFSDYIKFSKLKKKTYWLLIIGLEELVYFLIILKFRPNWNHLYPYKFFWS